MEFRRKFLTVAFETKCWQGDFAIILRPGHLAGVINRHNFNFVKRVLFINNIEPEVREQVRDMAFQRVADGSIDSFYFVDEHITEAMAAFKVTKEGLGKGYPYSSAELVSIKQLEPLADFLVHYAGDSALTEEHDWISHGLSIFKSHPNVFVVNPVWNGRVWEAASEASADHGWYFLGKGFSDQCYMVKTKDIANADLNLSHPDSSRYPAYGGELFEKRIDSYMRCNGLLRATLKHVSYTHPIF